ncbi:MAG TPA: threonine synthase [Bacillota bacterium]|nr:threonine synthase [Bacillota bacterium]
MNHVLGLSCVNCGREFTALGVKYHCDLCGSRGVLDVVYDYGLIRKNLTRETLARNGERSMWRYLPLLPLGTQAMAGIQPLITGFTPLYQAGRLASQLGITRLFIKDDSRNPTGSLKDRASAVAIAKAVELKQQAVCAASTGNAASSLAGFAASADIPAFIFVPKTAPLAKQAQLLVFGAQVFAVEGTYDEAYDLCLEAAAEFGWYNRSCAINPFLVEGKKTVALEICEQLDWDVPDVVIMAAGDGCSIAAAWKGFKEAQLLGLTDRLPRMIGVQAAGANPLTRAFAEDTPEFAYRRPRTIADSISVGIPRNGIRALRSVRESGGFFIDVQDQEILSAMSRLARSTGIFAEPAGATSFAGLLSLLRSGGLSGGETVVIAVTGSGLKDVASAMTAVPQAIQIEPSLQAVKNIMGVH